MVSSQNAVCITNTVMALPVSQLSGLILDSNRGNSQVYWRLSVKVGDLVRCIGFIEHGHVGVVMEISLNGHLRVLINGEVNHLWQYQVEVISESR